MSIIVTGKSAKERPILFSRKMVRALLAGRKTQTRCAVKLPHNNPLGEWQATTIGGPNGGRTKDGQTILEQGAIWHTRTGDTLVCPHGEPGDRLWYAKRREARSLIQPNGKRIARTRVPSNCRGMPIRRPRRDGA